MNLNTNNLKFHFFTAKKKQKEEKKVKTKIINYCFYAINEANISKKIKKIPYYSNYYIILEDYDFINISTFHEKIVEKVKLIDENKKYLLFKYKPYSYSFDDFLLNFKKPKVLIFNIIKSFSYLLQSLIQLENEKLVFFQLSHENIVFEESYRENPLLKDFQLSLQVSKLNEEYITQIIKKTSDYSLKPLEIHILFYLIENEMNTISYSFIEEIVEIFIKNLEILSFFSQDERENFQKSCVNYLKKYINMSKKDIILDILNNYKKWDIYSISVLYFHVFHNISLFFSLNQTFINEIMRELTKNIHPDPSKRSSLSELLETSKKLLNCDWSFINLLEDKKIDKLWEN
jgi:hypothetical protein